MQAVSRFIDICPKIPIQCLKLYIFLIFGWWLSNIILDMNEHFICWCSGPAFQQAGCMETIWTPTSPYPNEASSYWGMTLPQSQTLVDFGTDCCSLFNRQALFTWCYPRHMMVETSVVKQPFVVTVLATSARLNHWWGCNPFKCWSHLYVRPDLCHDCCWCSSSSGSNVTSRPSNDFIVLYVPPVRLTIDGFD